jgi:ribonuclease VapC
MLMLLNQEPGYEKIRDYLNEAQSAQRDVLMSAINVGETYYIVHRERGEPTAEQFLTLLKATQVLILTPTLEDILAAAKIKAKYPISYADVFAAATAIREGVSVVTGNPEFQKLERIVTVEWVSNQT